MDIRMINDWRFRVVNQIEEIEAEAWNRCANPTISGEPGIPGYNPFISHEFLCALEMSGSVGHGTGWTPSHLVLEKSRDKSILGVVPMYIKDHSQGEYVFDFQWADAFENAGGEYYPKLQVAVPFTPVSGSRILVKPGKNETAVSAALIEKSVLFAEKSGVSSLHFTFLRRNEWDELGRLGLLKRTDQQFRWRNDEYGAFDDFVNQLSAKKRRNIKRERRIAMENEVTIEHLTGNQITERHWDAFFNFYMDTGSRKWGSPYLNREFFSLLGRLMPEKILLVMCRLGGRYVAGALNMIGGDTLYGRYWGCLGDFPCLHFEVCYYQAIEFAIANRLRYVEAGAQGEHKLARGYLPNITFSAHWIAHPRFRDVLTKYLLEERQYVDDHVTFLNQRSPYKS